MSVPAEREQQSASMDRRGPRIFVPPPLIMLSLLASGWLAEQYWGIQPFNDSWSKPFGILMLLLSLLLAISAALPFVFHKTSIEPWQPTSTIIQNGVYGVSRNPIYLAICLAASGSGFYLNSFWMLASVAPLILILRYAVIRREETYLENKFGDTYLAYKQRVRRWF